MTTKMEGDVVAVKNVGIPGAAAPRVKDQKVSYYHPTGKGDGTALRLEPRFNRVEADRHNCFYLEMAPQKTLATREADQRNPATFDWEKKLTIKLGFMDICEMLTVLEGRQEKVGGPRNGLYHDSAKAVSVISFMKNSGREGYLLGVSRKDKADGQLVRMHISLSDAEAAGLRCILQTGLFFLAFHSQLFGWTQDRGRDVSGGALN